MRNCPDCGLPIKDIPSCWYCFTRKCSPQAAAFSYATRELILYWGNGIAQVSRIANNYTQDRTQQIGETAIKGSGDLAYYLYQNGDSRVASVPIDELDYYFTHIKNPPAHLNPAASMNQEITVEKKGEILYHLRFWEKLSGNNFWFDGEVNLPLSSGKDILVKDAMINDSVLITNLDTGEKIKARVVRIDKEEKDDTFTEVPEYQGYYLRNA
jgi:hypothetical protein